MKKLIALLVALSMSLTTGLALADTDPMAEALARQQVPATAALTSTDFEDRTLEFKFEDKASGMAYEVTLNRQPLSVRKVVSRLQGGRGAQEVSLTKEDAVKALMEMYPAAQLGEVFIEQDDGRFQFLITFTTGDDNVIYRARLHAQNGRLLGLSVKHGAEGAQFIKLGAAAQAAISTIPDGRVVDVELEEEDGRYCYEVEVLIRGRQREVKIDALTGAVISAHDDDLADLRPADEYKPGDLMDDDMDDDHDDDQDDDMDEDHDDMDEDHDDMDEGHDDDHDRRKDRGRRDDDDDDKDDEHDKDDKHGKDDDD